MTNGTEMTNDPSTVSRQTAFNIMAKHSECFRDDVSMNDLIDDIATAIDVGLVAADTLRQRAKEG